MNAFDIVLAILLMYGFIRGLLKGLFVEVASLLSLILGVYGAIHFSSFTSNLLVNYVNWDEKYLTLISFAITFGVIVIVVALLGKIFTKIANFAALGFLNKLLGGVFGALKIALILSVVLIIFSKLNQTLPFVSPEKQQESILFNPVKNFAPTLFPDFFKINEKTEQNE